jgi:prepilin-type N-terminal cleavage/methylation domain-containing protein
MKNRKGFTLIELLVVIAIIAMLLAIISPALNKARAYAWKSVCKSNNHQVGVSIANYEATYRYNFRQKTDWYYFNGTGDYAYESYDGSKNKPAPYAVDALMRNKFLPDRKAFFCPAVKNISHKNNYLLSKASAGDYTVYDTGTIDERVASGVLASNEAPLFWSTSIWLWKKKLGGETLKNSPVSNGVLMVDMTNEAWRFAELKTSNANLVNLFKMLNLRQRFQHFNALMQDNSVVSPGDKDENALLWLWDSDRWAGGGY